MDSVLPAFGSSSVDEIHRWNRSQQEGLLPHIEAGTITLVGAPTENPFCSLVGPLISRSRVFRLEPLTPDHIRSVLLRAIRDPERGCGALNLDVSDQALDHWIDVAHGDARSALNAAQAHHEHRENDSALPLSTRRFRDVGATLVHLLQCGVPVDRG